MLLDLLVLDVVTPCWVLMSPQKPSHHSVLRAWNWQWSGPPHRWALQRKESKTWDLQVVVTASSIRLYHTKNHQSHPPNTPNIKKWDPRWEPKCVRNEFSTFFVILEMWKNKRPHDANDIRPPQVSKQSELHLAVMSWSFAKGCHLGRFVWPPSWVAGSYEHEKKHCLSLNWMSLTIPLSHYAMISQVEALSLFITFTVDTIDTFGWFSKEPWRCPVAVCTWNILHPQDLWSFHCLAIL